MEAISSIQKKTAQAIINIFETSQIHGDYGRVTVLRGDTGGLTYGKSQTTLNSGNLALLLSAYIHAGGEFAGELQPWLSAFESKDSTLDRNLEVHDLLRRAGNDPIMRDAQDTFFDKAYWLPAARSAGQLGLSKPLSYSVVYDSFVHGSFRTIRDSTISKAGTIAQAGESSWIETYISTRRNWLENHSNVWLPKTVYRMDSFRSLIDENRWELPLPLVVRGIQITEAILNQVPQPAVPASAAGADERVLRLASPLMQGDDVRRLQEVLGMAGADLDGVYGTDTEKRVREFQRRSGLTDDGIVGPVTWSAIENA